LTILRFLGGSKLPFGKRIPWQHLDLSDPTRPRLLCAVSELPLLDETPTT
jgi:hypothetical protein